MTDRELLELAAKAAGIPLKPDFAERFDYYMADRLMWNPLTNDGDALRLAVKLGLYVCIDTPQESEPHTKAIGFANNGLGTIDAIEYHGDPYAATRRAITCAAAEIERGLL